MKVSRKGLASNKLLLIVAAVVLAPFVALGFVLACYWIGLPSQTTVSSAEYLGQVFAEYKAEGAAAVLPKGVGSYPPLLNCTICDGAPSTKCTLKMAIHVGRMVSGHHLRRHIFFTLDSLFLGGAMWLRYDQEQIQRLYLAVYTSYKDYHGLESVCGGLFHKTCSTLSREEVVYLDAWIRGHDLYMKRLKDDHAEFEKRLTHLVEMCK